MSAIHDMEYDLMSYCIRLKGKWWANHLFRNAEVDTLYRCLRGQDAGTVAAILGCNCSDYEKHIRFYNKTVKPILEKKTPEKPKIICLCGSTRFYEQFQTLNYLVTMGGYIVLSVGFLPHSTGQEHGQNIGCSEEERKKLIELHLRKIDLANEIFVINVGGYIGSDTLREIEYAVSKGKSVTYDEPKNETAREAERKGRLISEGDKAREAKG